MHRSTTGGHSLHDSSNGQRLIDLACSKNMVISSTYFLHRNIHKKTWASLDGHTFNQINYVLIRRRWASSILDVRTLRGANWDSDHYLVRVKYRCRIFTARGSKTKPTRRFDTDRLWKDIISQQYRSALGERLEAIRDNADNETVNDTWTKIKTEFKGERQRV